MRAPFRRRREGTKQTRSTTSSRPCPSYGQLAVLIGLLVLLAATSSGCSRTLAAPPRPDLAGVWNVVYDDHLDAELRIGKQVQRVRLRREGGALAFSNAEGTVSFEIDCSREDLLCPQEVWPRELTLSNRVGDLDDEGQRLSLSLANEGHGPCALQPSSLLHAEVVTTGTPLSRDWQAMALSNGQVTTIVSGECLGARGVAGKALIALTAGISAVRR